MSTNAFKVEHRYLELPDSFYTRVKPTPLSQPAMVCFNHKLAEQMGFHVQDEAEWASVGAGAELLEGMDPVAMKYTGHQFGVYNPELGDGRGLLLWETVAPDGTRWDWHLKGQAPRPTPALAMAGRCCAPPFANTCARKPCTVLAFRPPAPCL